MRTLQRPTPPRPGATPKLRPQQPLWQLLAIIGLTIFITEFAVMLIISLLPEMSTHFEALVDGVFLLLMLLPTLYYLIYMPLRGQIEQLEQAQSLLTASEKRFRDVANHVGEWIWETDAEGRFTYSNSMIERMLGYTPKEIIGRHFYDFFLDEERDELRQTALALFSKKQLIRSFVSRNRHRDGRTITLDCSALPLLDGNGTLTGYRGADRDITEQILAQNRLMDAKSAAESANRAKGAFLANMSHELRTPINGTLGNLELLKDSDLDDEQARLVRTAAESSNHLLGIIDRLLQYSQLDGRTLDVQSRPFDPHALIQTLDSSMRPLAANKGLRFESVCDSQMPTELLGDMGHIKSVLEHLIDNAIKFTHRGSIRIEANYEVSGERSGTLHLHVLDTGIGIPDDNIDRLFEEFTQYNESPTRRYGGTGVGLALCRRLIESMRGRIGVDRRLSGGTIFWVALPLENTTVQTVRTAQTVQTVQTAQTAQSLSPEASAS